MVDLEKAKEELREVNNNLTLLMKKHRGPIVT